MKKTASCILLLCGTLVMYLTGCGKSISQQEALSKSSEESYVTLKALTIGVPPEDGMDQYYEELDKKTEELGCHLRFDYIPWGMNVHRLIWQLLPVNMILFLMGIFRITINRQQKVHFWI